MGLALRNFRSADQVFSDGLDRLIAGAEDLSQPITRYIWRAAKFGGNDLPQLSSRDFSTNQIEEEGVIPFLIFS